MKLALLLVLLSLPALADADRLVELGPTRAQRDSDVPQLDFPFVARADEQLTRARVRLTFTAPPQGAEPPPGVEVLVNDESVGVLGAAEVAAGGVRELEVSGDVLADRNQLSLKVRTEDGRCAARAGAWRTLKQVAVAVQATPVPLPNELALLPLPFFDRGFDQRAQVPVVLAAQPGPGELRLAALVASWFAVDAPIPLDFVAHVGALPDSRAIVLLGGSQDATKLGLEAPDGPLVQLVDHPAHPDSNVKLLVIGGRNPQELRLAVEALVARTEKLAGDSVHLKAAPAAAPTPPWSAPRWVPSDHPVRFADYPESPQWGHEGSTPATLAVRFRIAPDLWMWPSEFVVLDLGWAERIPQGFRPPRIDVELNGYFLATLPPLQGQGEQQSRIRLRIPREHMRGFNQLLVHVHYAATDPCAAADTGTGRGEQPRVSILNDSVLHLEGFSHFARLPDVSLFAFDGYPFSRVPDLGETAVVVPERPVPAQLSMVLSVFGQLAQVTGRVGTRATFLSAARATEAELRDKELLVVGDQRDNPWVARWSDRLPIIVESGRARVQRPWTAASLLDLLGGLGPLLDLNRAREVLQATPQVAALAALESPASPGRTAVLVTATDATRLPSFHEFLGYAEARTRSGDLLLSGEGRRWLFGVGTSFGQGHLNRWTELRWFLASHWMALLPLLLGGVLVLSGTGLRFVTRRMRERLALGGAVAALLLAFGAHAEPRRCATGPWMHWNRYVETFVSQDGRVIDHNEADRTTSEGQAYAMFFALVANDRPLFGRLLAWTEANLAQGDLGKHLPAWNWGKRKDGTWGVLDPNSASDADLWLAYDLLEAGRLWNEPRHAALARALLAQVVRREVTHVAGVGAVLLPGPEGFVLPGKKGVRINPSYEPPQLYARFASAGIPGPWRELRENALKLLGAQKGAVPDWALVRAGRGFGVDPVRGRVGSYEAIRSYLWVGMLAPDDPARRQLVPVLGALLRGERVPEKIDVQTLRAQGVAPPGFAAALLPLAEARGDAATTQRLRQRVAESERDGLLGSPPAYYDQNLALFGRGFSEGRFRFDLDGGLVPAWEAACVGKAP